MTPPRKVVVHQHLLPQNQSVHSAFHNKKHQLMKHITFSTTDDSEQNDDEDDNKQKTQTHLASTYMEAPTPSSTNSANTTPSKTASNKIEFIDLAKRRLSSGQLKADLLPYLSIFKSPSKRREST